jgi:hypothetical protein
VRINLKRQEYFVLEQLARKRGITLEEAARGMLEEFIQAESTHPIPSALERRRSQRKKAAYPAVVKATSRGTSAFSKALVRDFSMGGIRLQLQGEKQDQRTVFAQAEQLEVVFTVPESRDFIHLHCHPRWNNSNGTFCLAGELKEGTPRSLSRLELFLAD